ELDEAKLQAEEQEQLEDEQKKLEHAEEIKIKLNEAYQIISESEFNAAAAIKDAVYALGQISAYGDSFQTLKNRLESVMIELNDVAEEITDAERLTEADPERAEVVQERLNLIYTLQRKHQVQSIAELLEIQQDLEQKVGNVHNLDAEIAATRKQMEQAFADVKKLAKQLSETRTNIFRKFEEELHSLLAELGMPNARSVIHHSVVEPTATGTDEISILFSANKGAAPQTLIKAASGGEFSRLMLAVKYMLADKTALPTIVFDEIDTGISGEIAVKVGKMMQQMAQKHQLICISHLPQIAAQGDAHYFVYKMDREDRTVSNIKKLSKEERINEIAQMIAGANPSNTAFESDRELMEMS
ncbi:MAG: DNA repair protein RecN, partial [Hymenobacteraceae bacterium]|nr:DNA repair protein RecN [Hymenobacteraceae bacterium]MDX5395094.1 DNA repair protein RecN [Hymenobacteraceae bacterium]MDX5511132.1 DNA repair protein RecN [Hymenobacteraceae bacterium]